MNSGLRKHRTPSGLAMLMIRIVSRWAPDRRLRLIGDAWYATHEMAALLNEKSAICPNGSLVSRFQWEARLHADPGEYTGFGRPRIIGERFENPRRMSQRDDVEWVLCEVDWYGASRKEFMLLSGEGAVVPLQPGRHMGAVGRGARSQGETKRRGVLHDRRKSCAGRNSRMLHSALVHRGYV